jgi:uncharacterized protein YeaO (DUF488 family)
MTRRRRGTVAIRRIYDVPGTGEGYRVLVDRLWPRGIKRTPDLFDEWAKDAAPSDQLRRWYGHDPAKYDGFARRYRAELEQQPASEAVARLAGISRREPVTLLTATRDVAHSGAQVLSGVIERS